MDLILALVMFNKQHCTGDTSLTFQFFRVVASFGQKYLHSRCLFSIQYHPHQLGLEFFNSKKFFSPVKCYVFIWTLINVTHMTHVTHMSHMTHMTHFLEGRCVNFPMSWNSTIDKNNYSATLLQPLYNHNLTTPTYHYLYLLLLIIIYKQDQKNEKKQKTGCKI